MRETELAAVDSERLGQRLRELRLGAGMSLRALARELGISPSAVSQIERGTMRPSVSRLIAYVSAIGVPLAAVFDAEGTPEEAARELPHIERFAIRRAWEASPIRLGGSVAFRRLSPLPIPGVEFFESTYPPGSVSTEHGQFLRHEGYEVGTVTQGELTIEFETEVVTLAEGDSITYSCDRPHIIGNRSETETAVATWLILRR
jgi:transcriptional regulator with XRE-family HTH domain